MNLEQYLQQIEEVFKIEEFIKELNSVTYSNFIEEILHQLLLEDMNKKRQQNDSNNVKLVNSLIVNILEKSQAGFMY